MYLEAQLLAADTQQQVSTNGTSKRLSTIEITMMAGVMISALSLGLNIWNTMRKAS